mgnify:CR=1 FL=1
MALIDGVKAALRVDGTEHDTEISDLIVAAQWDLILSGVSPEKANDSSDPLIKRAIIVYARAQFEWDHPNAERLQAAYDMLKAHLSLSADYRAAT